jgi:protein transport protein SEC23
MNRLWVCPFCLTRNHLPQYYSDISAENLPAELIGDYTTLVGRLGPA